MGRGYGIELACMRRSEFRTPTRLKCLRAVLCFVLRELRFLAEYEQAIFYPLFICRLVAAPYTCNIQLRTPTRGFLA